ncbi:Xylan 1,3-beta-xylosidase [Pontiella desulfatans]|uniref:Xylan 1,3-beta-xylosidase n=2 Tax=Pontiella desulfatans TaxID=2750659 RepID=A0A6C2U8D2_PONDE|nr:Xylan 1,3-beta-xylosidase [Pontiella desulfatans]
MPELINPVLTGFNPDPSIVAVGEDYYIATSTFEWFPGVQIHHSKDLVHWRLLTRVLDRVSQLDLRGCQHSGGVWAPCLTYADDQFWLVYTNVRSHGGPVTDSPHFLVTAPDIEGPWSEPVVLGANGFDPSLFHDKGGKKYLVNMQMGSVGAVGVEERFDGITIQEYCHDRKKLVGERIKIWEGTELGVTEGPHIYRKDGWYYLLTAEGGTAFNHAVSVARSRNLTGPYEADPDGPMLTSANRPDLNLKSAGHGDLFQSPDGSWFTVHLCHRPLQKRGVPETAWDQDKVAILGRETGIQRVAWPDGEFPRLADGGNAPSDIVPAPEGPLYPWEDALRDDFNGPVLNPHFQTLREPADESWLSLSRCPGSLSLKGRNSLFSRFDQSLVARRLQHFRAEAETGLVFSPTSPKQEAGLIAYYDRNNYHYLRMAGDGKGGCRVGVVSSDFSPGMERPLITVQNVCDLKPGAKIYLKMMNEHADLRFAWSLNGEEWNWIEQTFDSTNMGDWSSAISGFAGTFWGLCCQDMTGDGIWAEFDCFDYRIPVKETL